METDDFIVSEELLNDQSWVLVTDEKFEYNFFKVVVEMKR